MRATTNTHNRPTARGGGRPETKLAGGQPSPTGHTSGLATHAATAVSASAVMTAINATSCRLSNLSAPILNPPHPHELDVSTRGRTERLTLGDRDYRALVVRVEVHGQRAACAGVLELDGVTIRLADPKVERAAAGARSSVPESNTGDDLLNRVSAWRSGRRTLAFLAPLTVVDADEEPGPDTSTAPSSSSSSRCSACRLWPLSTTCSTCRPRWEGITRRRPAPALAGPPAPPGDGLSSIGNLMECFSF